MFARRIAGVARLGARPVAWRPLSTLRRRPPLYGHEKGSDIVVSLSPKEDAAPLGSFPADKLALFAKAFEEPEFASEPCQTIENPSLFNLNRDFMRVVHRVIGENITDEHIFGSMIQVAADGNLFYSLYDLRAPPAYGRIPEVEDTLGMIEIRNGQVVRGSYEANNMYRPVSSYGFITLPDKLNELVRDELEK